MPLPVLSFAVPTCPAQPALPPHIVFDVRPRRSTSIDFIAIDARMVCAGSQEALTAISTRTKRGVAASGKTAGLGRGPAIWCAFVQSSSFSSCCCCCRRFDCCHRCPLLLAVNTVVMLSPGFRRTRRASGRRMKHQKMIRSKRRTRKKRKAAARSYDNSPFQAIE